MKLKLIITAIVFASPFFISNVKAQLYDLLIDDDLKEDASDIVNQMLAGLDRLLNDAMNRSDFITENRLKEASIVLDGFKNFIHNERVDLLNGLDQERLEVLKGIDQMLAGRIPDVYALHDLTAIMSANISDLLNSLGGVIASQDKFEIYRITGLSLEFKESGIYKVSIIGNIFNKSDISNRIIINGQERELLQGANKSNMYIEIPSHELKSYYRDTTVNRIPIQIYSVKKNRSIFNTKNDTLVSWDKTITLHPKFPIKYELIEISTPLTWSSPIKGQLVEKDVPKNVVTYISATAPEGILDSTLTKFYDPSDALAAINARQCNATKDIKRIIRIPMGGGFPDHDVEIVVKTAEQINKECESQKDHDKGIIGNWISNPIYYQEYRSVRRAYKCSKDIRVWVEAYYKKEVPGKPIEIKRNFINFDKGVLTYGTHQSEYFTNTYASYKLRIKYFHSDWYLIDPTAASNVPGIKTGLQLGSVNGLTINIQPLTR